MSIQHVLVIPGTPGAFVTLEQASILQRFFRTPEYVLEFVLNYWHALNTVQLYGENYDVFYDACVEDWDQEFIRMDGSEGDNQLHQLFSQYADQYVQVFFDLYARLSVWLPPLVNQNNLYYTLHKSDTQHQLLYIAVNRQDDYITPYGPL